MSTNTTTEKTESTDTEPVKGFDPKHDTASGITQADIRGMYEKLVGRGKDEKAAELRREPSVAEQMRLTKNAQEFDPEHDDPDNTRRIKVKNAYDALLDLADENEDEDSDLAERARDAAETLRECQTTSRQAKKVSEYKREFGISVF